MTKTSVTLPANARSGRNGFFRSVRVGSVIAVIAVIAGAAPARAGPFVLAGQPGGAGNCDTRDFVSRLNFPSAIAFDGKAYFYVADTLNSTIRKIAYSNGKVSTFAGKAGLTGTTDGKGALARFNHPAGIAFDGAATFNQPTPLVYNGAGDLFVADSGNSLVREIVLASGKVSTALGVADSAGVIAATPTTFKGLWQVSGGAQQPRGLAFGTTTGLYIADAVENVILIAH